MNARFYKAIRAIYKRYRKITYDFGLNRPYYEAKKEGNIKVILAIHHVSRMQNMYRLNESIFEASLDDKQHARKRKKPKAKSKGNSTEKIIEKILQKCEQDKNLPPIPVTMEMLFLAFITGKP